MNVIALAYSGDEDNANTYIDNCYQQQQIQHGLKKSGDLRLHTVSHKTP